MMNTAALASGQTTWAGEGNPIMVAEGHLDREDSIAPVPGILAARIPEAVVMGGTTAKGREERIHREAIRTTIGEAPGVNYLSSFFPSHMRPPVMICSK